MGIGGLECGLRAFEAAADIAEVGHACTVDDGDASGGAFDGGLATFMRSQALAAESKVGRPGEATEFARGVSEVDNRVGGRHGSAGGTLVPRQSAGAGLRGDFGAAFGVTRDE